MASFKLPTVPSNQENWGPTPISSKLTFLPYSPLALTPSQPPQQQYGYQQQTQQQQQALKADFKLGKIADWTLQAGVQPQKVVRAKDEEVVEEEEEEEFSLVVSSKQKAQKQMAAQKKGAWGARGQQQQQQQQRQAQKRGAAATKYPTKRYPAYRSVQQQLKPSVEIKPQWKLVSTYNLQDVSKMNIDNIPKVTELGTYGSVEFYDPKYDKVNTKTPIALQRFDNRVFFNNTTSDDPVLTELINKEPKPTVEEGERVPITIFTTDIVMAALMCAPRSVQPWDIVLKKQGHVLILDKRDFSEVDLQAVDETSREPPVFDDDRSNINSAQNLREEATVINLNFSQQVLNRGKGSRKRFENPNPFQGDNKEENLASCGYKYRRWQISDFLTVVCRCQFDGVEKIADEDALIVVRALNEYIPKPGYEWRQRLDDQRGAIFINELKNNLNKLSKWTTQAYLAAVDVMKIGFVSRAQSANNTLHYVLAVEKYKPQDFAKQIELSTKNIWGIFKAIMDSVSKQPDGRYVMLKDPARQYLQLYSVPETDNIEPAREEEEEEEEDTPLGPEEADEADYNDIADEYL